MCSVSCAEKKVHNLQQTRVSVQDADLGCSLCCSSLSVLYCGGWIDSEEESPGSESTKT